MCGCVANDVHRLGCAVCWARLLKTRAEGCVDVVMVSDCPALIGLFNSSSTDKKSRKSENVTRRVRLASDVRGEC